jgi:predicted AlkP superfamily phosphohydrolase/phosphomutase
VTVRLVVLGWDSATFDVIDPLLAAGELPAIKELSARGHRGVLRSTWPPMTDCAWTSAFTGLNAGAHGIFGSWYRAPGAYAARYFSSRDRKAPALWEIAEDPRFLAWNIPMAFPPSPVSGAMVSGYGAPPGANFCSPPELQAKLAQRWDLDDLLDRAPHGSLESFREDLLRGLQTQPDALSWAADEVAADCVLAVWPHVDRAQHFFWRFRGTDHPLASTVDDIYRAMDRATSRLLEAWPDADFLIVSDHGAGPLKGDVNMGAWLEAEGLARMARPRRNRAVDLAWSLPPAVRRAGRRLAPNLARKTLGATLSGQLAPFEWSETKAFVGFHGDLWLNLKEREPAGIVETTDAPELLESLRDELLALRDERDGSTPFHAVHRRHDIYSGPCIDLAPDLMLDSWSNGYRVSPKRGSAEAFVGAPLPLAGVDEPWSSDHRPEGVFVAAGPSLAGGITSELSLLDVCPTALALLAAAIPEGLDGRVAEAVMTSEFLEAHPIRITGAADTRQTSGEYSEEEAQAVAAHLKDLGYIE